MTVKPKILIIGGNSWLATWFFKTRLCGNYFTIVLSRDNSSYGDKRVIGDAKNYLFLKELLSSEDPDYIINFVGIKGIINNYVDVFNVNVGITANLLFAIRETNVKSSVLVIGSAAEYGNIQSEIIKETSICQPSSVYGITKLQQTELMKNFQLTMDNHLKVARIFNLLGPGMPKNTIGEIIYTKVKEISGCSKNECLQLQYPDMERDFLSVSEASKMLEILLINEDRGIFNLCSGIPETLGSLARKFGKLYGFSEINISQNYEIASSGDYIHSVIGCNHKIVSRITEDINFDALHDYSYES